MLEAIEKKKLSDLGDLFIHCQLTREEFNSILHPIIDSCTKDAISVSIIFLEEDLLKSTVEYRELCITQLTI